MFIGALQVQCVKSCHLVVRDLDTHTWKFPLPSFLLVYLRTQAFTLNTKLVVRQAELFTPTS